MTVLESVKALTAESHKNPKIQGGIYVQVSLKTAPTNTRQYEPILIALPHKFRRTSDCTTCLVVKDPASQYDTLLNTERGPIFDDVVGVGKLRRRLAGGKKNRTTKATEEFAKSFTAMFVDARVAEPLIECLGPKYYKHCKHLPVKIGIPPQITDRQKKELKIITKRVLRSTQLILRPEGKTISVLVGHTSMDSEKVAQNINALVTDLEKRFTDAVYFVKTAESIALPISI